MSNSLTADLIKALEPVPGVNLLITVGNDLRRDDGIGPYISSQLVSSGCLRVLEAGFRPEAIIDQAVEFKPAKVIIIDAADFGGRAGEIRTIAPEMIPQTTMSTHMIPMSAVAQLIAMDTGAQIIFVGIQPKDVSYGPGLCAQVKSAADELISAIKEAYYARDAHH